jgi:uncharacterized protein (TIGR02270 family)
MSAVIKVIIEQHASEAAFLWATRDFAVHAPHFSLDDLAKLDDRLEANIDGLRIAGSTGLEIALAALERGDASEIFVAAVLLIERGDIAAAEPVLAHASESVAASRGFISALGWADWAQAAPFVEQLCGAESPILRRIGIAGSSIHRQDPGDVLNAALRSNDPPLLARASKAAGELGRRDLLDDVRELMSHDDEAVKFRSASAAALLGDRGAARALGEIAAEGRRFAEAAAALGIRLFSEAVALRAFNELTSVPELGRVAATAAGASGYPMVVPWLIEQMRVAPLARVAGEAFTTITGVDLTEHDLEGDAPEGFFAGPTENPEDTATDLDPDEYLPWPKADAVADWWHAYAGEFAGNTRYLLGNPMTGDWLQEVLRIGRQRQRRGAAVEIALRAPGQSLFETRASFPRQRALLAARSAAVETPSRV